MSDKRPYYTVRAKQEKETRTKGRNGYDREIIGAIVYNSLIVHGSDKKAVEAASISAKTFYEWIHKHDDFKHLVNEAKTIYAKTNNLALQANAVQRLAENLTTGRVTVRRKTTNEGYSEEIVTNHGTDMAAISLVLANLQINTAIETLHRNGYLVIDPNNQSSDETGGLTPETIDNIKREILGIDETKT